MKEFFSESLYFGLTISIGAYGLGLLARKKLKWGFLNPLLLAIVAVIVVLNVLDVDDATYNESAKYLSYLLTPATVCLAVPLYQQMELLKQNFWAVFWGITAGVLSSLGSVFGLAYLFGLSHEQYVTLLPKSITTAIGIGVSEELGGISTITVAVIIVTGVLGNREPIAVGLSLGTASHAIGTAKALELGEVQGAMSSLSIAVSGLMTVIGASVFATFL